MNHVEEVLQILSDSEFYAKLKKCYFEKEELNFLGHVIGKDGVKPDPKKVEVSGGPAFLHCQGGSGETSG